MNKIKLIKIITFLTLSMFTSLSFAQDKIMPYSQVPSEIKSYIKNHFPKHSVIQSEIDMEGLSKQYEITLSEGIELKFNNKNQIINIDGKSKLPDSVIPKNKAIHCEKLSQQCNNRLGNRGEKSTNRSRQ